MFFYIQNLVLGNDHMVYMVGISLSLQDRRLLLDMQDIQVEQLVILIYRDLVVLEES